MDADRLRHIQTWSLLTLAVIAAGAALHWLQPVVVPFILALFFAIALTPLVELAMRWLRLPRAAAVILTLVVAFVVLGGLGVLITKSMGQLAANLGVYQQRLEELLGEVVVAMDLEKLGVDTQQVLDSLVNMPSETIRGALTKTTSAIIDIVSDGVLVLIFLCFLLFGGSPGRSSASGTLAEGVTSTRRYIIAKALVSVVTGILVGLILWVLGVPLALGFGLMAFLLNFIPSIGSIVATLLPLPMILANPEISSLEAILAVVLPGLVQLTIGNGVEPRMMGRRFRLHPITILLALIFFGMLWGIVGMFLATPLTAVLRSFLERNEMTVPLGRLLSGHVDGRDKS